MRRTMTLALGAILGCGSATPPPASPAPSSAEPPAPTAPAAAARPAAAPAAPVPVTPVSASEPAAEAPAPAPAATRTDVLLDTKLPPKVVTTGGSYSVMVSDTVGLTRAEAMGAIESAGKTIDACFAEIFKAGGKRGKVSVTVALDDSARVKSTRVQLDELGDKKVAKCLEGAIKKMGWAKPAARGGASLSIDWLVQS